MTLQVLITEFESIKGKGERTLEQLTLEHILYSPSAESNSIAVIVKHLHGNMLSRWTEFLTTDGEKPWRKRDDEFVLNHLSKEELFVLWQEGWSLVMDTLHSLKEEDLSKDVYLRGEKHTVYEAILRQLSHYSSHVGQMMYIGKMLLNENWISLSIPKRKSKEFLEKKRQEANR